jgi:hypothetical protein
MTGDCAIAHFALLLRWAVLNDEVLKWVPVTKYGPSSGCGWQDGLQIWRVRANILNKQSRTTYKGWSSSLGGLGEVISTPRLKTYHVTKRFTRPRIWDNPLVAGSFERGNEPSGSIKRTKYID